jgi:two-component system, chemotaxis family, CheB/CheR fusion protein
MLRVLVVDDYRDSTESLAMILRLAGHQVEVADDGASGLEAAKANWPDVVLLDIGLPIMDGFEVARCIQLMAAARRMPLLIAVTGYGDERLKLRCHAEGFDRHLLKPIDPTGLLEILDGVCQARHGFSEAG